ncbi:MAG: TIGR00266 family protein [Myxococcota bacterium]|nr:TIGR00266 family protein [Myxococcota bacterium]
MKTEMLQKPDFGILKVVFEAAGESIVCESGAMVSRSTGIHMKTSMRGGLLAAAKRKLLGGESLFQNVFTATDAGQEIYLAAAPEGDLERMELQAGDEFYLQSGAYLASDANLILDTKWGGVKGLFGPGMFLIKVVGPGTVWFNSYGALHAIDVNGQFTCDNDHVVGFGPGLDYKMRAFGGMKGFFFSGEAFVCEFNGQGRLYAQTRRGPNLASFLHPYRPVQKSSD